MLLQSPDIQQKQKEQASTKSKNTTQFSQSSWSDPGPIISHNHWTD